MNKKENEMNAGGNDSVGTVVGKQRMTFKKFIIEYNAVIILAALVIVSSVMSPMFLTYRNIMTLFRQQATYMLIAIGAFLVMITGGIDLSVASTCAVSSVMTAQAMIGWKLDQSFGGLFLAVLIGIGCGLVIGVINGFLVAVFRVPAFIVTLATMWAAEGVAYIISNGTTMMLDSSLPTTTALVNFATMKCPVIEVPWIVLLAIVVIVAFYLIMTYTAFGRLILATGSCETAVKFAGINTSFYIFSAYAICGALTGLAGVIVTAKAGSATPLTSDVDYAMTAIAGIVIGGCSMSGGEGTIPKTVLGVLIVAVIGNIMNLMNIAVYPQMVVKAVIVIIAVILKSINERS